MKKTGFTLAEVLITLGIIGVVASLTAPALVRNTGSAKIGPSLAKAINTLEIANEALLADTGAATIPASNALGTDSNNQNATYLTTLSKYMKLVPLNATLTNNYVASAKDYNEGVLEAPGNMHAGSVTASVLGDLQPQKAIKNLAQTKDGMYIGVDIDSNMRKKFNQRGEKVDRDEPNHILGFATIVIDINGAGQPNRMGKDMFLFKMAMDGTLHAYGENGGWQGTCDATTVKNGYACGASVLENDRKVIYN